MHHEGGQLIADGCLNQAIVKEIVGQEKNGTRAESSVKKTPIIFYVLLFGLLMNASGISAQQPAPAAQVDGSALKLTLDRAVGLALKQNPTAQIAVLQAAQSVQDKNIARAALLPQADLQVYDAVRRSNIQAQLGINFPGFPQHIGPINIFNAGPSFGMGTGIINLARNIGASVGIATVTTLLQRRTQFHQSQLVEHANTLSTAFQNKLHAITVSFTSGGSSGPGAALQAYGMIYSTVQRQAAMLAFIDNFYMLGMVFLTVIPVLMFLKRPPKGASAPVH